jgi:hypothetical protein
LSGSAIRAGSEFAPSAGTRWLERGVTLALLSAVSVAVFAGGFRESIDHYDECVYYYSATRANAGSVPYRDFAYAQPPGLLFLGQLCDTLGWGLAGVRAVCWGCGLLVCFQVGWLYRSVARSDASLNPSFPATPLTALFLSFSTVWVNTGSQGTTTFLCLPFVLASLIRSTKGTPPSDLIGGVWLGASTLFRVQPASLLPCFLILFIRARGTRNGVRSGLRFLVGFGTAAALIHGAMVLLFPNYLENIWHFHLRRTPTPFRDRLVQWNEFYAEPQTGMSVLLLMVLAFSPLPGVRGLAWFTGGALAITLFGGRSLYLPYFSLVLPVLLACTVLFFGAISNAIRTAGPVSVPVALALALVATRGVPVRGLLADIRAGEENTRRVVRELDSLPGGVVLTENNYLAILTKKKLVEDYYSTDLNVIYQDSPEKFRSWFLSKVPEADIVLVSANLLNWLSDRELKHLSACGKPLVFTAPEVRARFRDRVGD